VRKIWIFVAAGIAFGAVEVRPALAGTVVVGVNTIGAQYMNEQQQDALIEQLQKDGVKAVRTGIGDKFNRFIIRAYQHGIGAVVIAYPNAAPGAAARPANPSLGLQWAAHGITQSDPEKFKTGLKDALAPLEAAGVPLTAFELGNEINGPFFNGDFLPAQASGRLLGLPDLENPNDPEGRAIATSYRAYLPLLAALKEVRDHATANRRTPILPAGMAAAGLPGKRPGQKLDGVSVPATLAFLRQNGMDKLVDGYAVHVYPSGDLRRPLAARISDLDQDAFALCTPAKPCWLTEWGFGNPQSTCPIDEGTRAKLIQAERDAFAPFVKQGRLAALLYYVWSGMPGQKTEDPAGIFRCGALTAAGKLALSPM
jgi:hypothetical protein